MKVPKKSTLDRKLLALWSIKVRERAGNKCELCYSPAQNAHHYWGKRNQSTRYSLKNGVSLCYNCHVGQVKSAHESPDWFRGEIRKKRGVKWYNELMREWRKPKKWDISELQELAKKLSN